MIANAALTKRRNSAMMRSTVLLDKLIAEYEADLAAEEAAKASGPSVLMQAVAAGRG